MRLRPRAVAANNKKELTESQSALSLRGRQLGCSDVVASSEFKATIELAETASSTSPMSDAAPEVKARPVPRSLAQDCGSLAETDGS